MNHSHRHKRAMRQQIVRSVLIGLAVFIIIGGEGLLYQQLRKTDTYTFDPSQFATITEDQVLVTGTLTTQANCTNPVVVSEEDAAAFNPTTFDFNGRPVTEGTFKTVMRKDTPTLLTVLDESGALCLAAAYTATDATVTITPQITAASFNPLMFDVAGSVSALPLQSLPSYAAFKDYLSTALATNLMSQVVASPQYLTFVGQLNTEAAAAIPAS